MTRFIYLLAAFSAFTASAHANPWARDPGEVFLSYTLAANSTEAAISAGTFDADLYHSIYAEVGLGRSFTLGADIGGDDGSSLSQVFLRYTFTRAASPWQVASDLGFARRDPGTQPAEDLYRLGFSVGRGFARESFAWVPGIEPNGGWFSLDSHVLLNSEGDTSIWQSEATFGLTISDRFAAMLQLKAEEFPETDLALFLSPSALWTISEDTTVQLGTRFGLQGSEEVALRLGIWQEF